MFREVYERVKLKATISVCKGLHSQIILPTLTYILFSMKLISMMALISPSCISSKRVDTVSNMFTSIMSSTTGLPYLSIKPQLTLQACHICASKTQSTPQACHICACKTQYSRLLKLFANRLLAMTLTSIYCRPCAWE